MVTLLGLKPSLLFTSFHIFVTFTLIGTTSVVLFVVLFVVLLLEPTTTLVKLPFLSVSNITINDALSPGFNIPL